MIQLIATIILLGSFVSITVMVIRKIPALVQLPLSSSSQKGFVSSLWQRIKSKITETPSLKGFSGEKLLHRFLSKIKIFALRTESKAEKYLQQLRKKSKNQKQESDDNYWQELKETKDPSEKNFEDKSV